MDLDNECQSRDSFTMKQLLDNGKRLICSCHCLWLHMALCFACEGQ
jgi:hypothetical protein